MAHAFKCDACEKLVDGEYSSEYTGRRAKGDFEYNTPKITLMFHTVKSNESEICNDCIIVQLNSLMQSLGGKNEKSSD